MEGEHAARARRGIAFVAEKGFDAGGFVEERERAGSNGLDEVGEILRVVARLLGDAGEQRALLFRLDHADGPAIHEQEVIARAGFQRSFAQRDATTGGGIELPVILNDPAGRGELRVDLLAGALFWGVRHETAGSN